MKGNDLVPQHIESRRNCRWDLDAPLESIGCVNTVAAPGSRFPSSDRADFLDLGELKTGWLNGGAAGVTTRSEIIDDWALVRIGPLFPHHRHGVTSGYFGVPGSWRGTLMADHVIRAIGRLGQEAVIRHFSWPTSSVWLGLSIGIRICVPTWPCNSLTDERLDMTMGRDGSSSQKSADQNLGSHCLIVKKKE
jgi:hypothetical protein